MSDDTQPFGEITITHVTPENALLIQELVRRALRLNDFAGCEVSYTPPEASIEGVNAGKYEAMDFAYMDLTRSLADMLRDVDVLGLFYSRLVDQRQYAYPKEGYGTDTLAQVLNRRLHRLRDFYQSTKAPSKLEMMTRRLLALDMSVRVTIAVTEPKYTVDLSQRPKISRAHIASSEHIAQPDFVDGDGNVAYWTSIEIDTPAGTLVF